MHICFLYLSSPVDGHWDYFSVLATVINATVNIEVHVSSILAIIYPRAGLLDHIVVLFLISWEVAISVFKRLYHFIFLPNMYMDSSFFTFFPTCIIFWVFDNVFLWLGWMRMYTLHLVNVRYLFCTVTVLFFFFNSPCRYYVEGPEFCRISYRESYRISYILNLTQGIFVIL